MTKLTNDVPVTQADRDAADDWRRNWMNCRGEHTALIQAFARHRLTSQPAPGDLAEAVAQRFLGWKLPEDFNPDAGIKFTPVVNKGTKYEHRFEPTGTNLFSYTQAKAMFAELLQDLSAAQQGQGEPVADDTVVFTITVQPGHTQCHTQAGDKVVPAGAVKSAIKVLEQERSGMGRCPAHRSKRTPTTDTQSDAVRPSPCERNPEGSGGRYGDQVVQSREPTP